MDSMYRTKKQTERRKWEMLPWDTKANNLEILRFASI